MLYISEELDHHLHPLLLLEVQAELCTSARLTPVGQLVLGPPQDTTFLSPASLTPETKDASVAHPLVEIK